MEKIMSAKEITDIIFAICVFGWIPILVICEGISRIILAFKGIENKNGGVHISVTNKREEGNEEEDEF
jgi:hypothetical protein